MGFRFRKRLKLIPGVWLNLSKKGLSSLSIGSRGLTTNVNRQGARETISAPGTGVSYQTRRARLGHSRKISDKHEHRGAIRRPTGRRGQWQSVGAFVRVVVYIGGVLLLIWLLAHH